MLHKCLSRSKCTLSSGEEHPARQALRCRVITPSLPGGTLPPTMGCSASWQVRLSSQKQGTKAPGPLWLWRWEEEHPRCSCGCLNSMDCYLSHPSATMMCLTERWALGLCPQGEVDWWQAQGFQSGPAPGYVPGTPHLKQELEQLRGGQDPTQTVWGLA